LAACAEKSLNPHWVSTNGTPVMARIRRLNVFPHQLPVPPLADADVARRQRARADGDVVSPQRPDQDGEIIDRSGEIGIGDQDCEPRSGFEHAAADRVPLSPVRKIGDPPDVGKFALEPPDQGGRSIATAVVDEHQLANVWMLSHVRGDLAYTLGEPPFLVERGYDDRDRHG
jgi:hypothetical protein